MLYRFLLSKKGFSMVEILIVVVVLGVLSAVAVPVMGSIVGIKKREDCQNQQKVISATVKEVMFGMVDSGARQKKIDFSKLDGKRINDFRDEVEENQGESAANNVPTAYADKPCLVLTDEASVTGAATIGAIRGGYRDTSECKDYKEGCEKGNFLKKQKYESTLLVDFLANKELPICPFDDEDNPKYHYYIFEDGTVLCDCEKCLQAAN